MPPTEVFFCRALDGDVELTAERREHIHAAHRADAAIILANIRAVVTEPDVALRSVDNANEYLLSREVEISTGARHIVAIIVEQQTPKRLWIVTAFVTRRLSRGERWIAT